MSARAFRGKEEEAVSELLGWVKRPRGGVRLLEKTLCAAAQNRKWFIDRWRSWHLGAGRSVQPANFPNRLSIGRGCHLAGTLSEPGQRAPLFHKQKTAALRVMAALFERPSANPRPRLAGAKYKRNRPGMIEIFYVNLVGDFYANRVRRLAR